MLALGVAVILGLRDMQVLPTETTWWLLFWGVLAFVLAFPWGLLLELGSLTSFSMTATLRLGDDRTRPGPLLPATPPVAGTAATPPATDSPDSQEGSGMSWQQVWHTGDFDLAVQRAPSGEGRFLHRIVSTFGRAGAVALCRRPSAADGAYETLLVRSHRPAVGAELWELPRGFGDGEDPTPAHTALREYREETGLSATVRADLGPIFPDSGLLANAVHIVLLDASPAATPTAPDGEISYSRWCTEAEIAALIGEGLIADGIILAALHLAAVQARHAPAQRPETTVTEAEHSPEHRAS